MSIDEKINEAKKNDMNIKKFEKWEFSKSIPLQYSFSAYNLLPLSRISDKVLISEN